jgi:tripartite-type tricarboxylate transporter receptor subunit TctC
MGFNRVTSVAAACALALVASAAGAQTFPERSIRLVVPFPAGGPNDIIARVVSQKAGELLGQTIVIENRGGAGGVTGTDLVAKAAPDGYTVAITSAGALAIAPSLDRMPYQPLKDLKPITLVAKVPELLVVPKDSPAKTVAELVALAKSKAGALNYASTGPGGMPHLAAELLKSAAQIDVVHVPYSGAAPAVNDLIVARTQMMFADIPVLLPHVQSGALRALAVGSAARAASLPDVPTLKEAGLPAVQAENWYGLVAPAATPAPVVARLHGAFTAALTADEVRQKLAPQGAELIGDSPESFAAYIDAETKKWAEVVRVSGAKLK